MWRAWLDEFLITHKNQHSALECFLQVKITRTLQQYLRDDSGGEVTPSLQKLLLEPEIKGLVEKYLKKCQRKLSDNSKSRYSESKNVLRVINGAALIVILAIGAKSCMTTEEVSGEIHHRVIKAEDWRRDE